MVSNWVIVGVRLDSQFLFGPLNPPKKAGGPSLWDSPRATFHLGKGVLCSASSAKSRLDHGHAARSRVRPGRRRPVLFHLRLGRVFYLCWVCSGICLATPSRTTYQRTTYQPSWRTPLPMRRARLQCQRSLQAQHLHRPVPPPPTCHLRRGQLLLRDRRPHPRAGNHGVPASRPHVQARQPARRLPPTPSTSNAGTRIRTFSPSSAPTSAPAPVPARRRASPCRPL